MANNNHRIPLSTAISAFVDVTVPYHGAGGKSVISAFQEGDYLSAGKAAIYNYTGMHVLPEGLAETHFGFDVQTLNPFCMTAAPALKAYFWSKIITKITRKFLGNPISRIPYISDYVSWS